MHPNRLAGALAFLVYFAWVVATYIFEGRINEQLPSETVANVLLYFFIANVLIGIVLTIWTLQYLQRSDSITVSEAGFRDRRSSVLAILVGVVAGYLIYAGGLFGFAPSSLDPIVLFNGYIRALTVAIPSVLVCWALVGTAFAWLVRQKGRLLAAIVGTVVASLLFGLYHFAIGPPFNEVEVVVFSGMVIGVATSVFYFLSHNVYGTIAFITFQVMFGILHDAQNTGMLGSFTEPIICGMEWRWWPY